MGRIDDINKKSMNIILHAGDAREYFVNALDCVEKGEFENVESLLEKANAKIIEAHKIQTSMIQEAIEDDNPDITVLFIHAQDTLMSIKSEFMMVKRLIELYKKILTK